MPLKLYKSYNFVDKDPVIDLVRTTVEDSKLSYQKIHEDSGVSVTTLRNWFYKKTRRPQFCTVAAVVRACGEDMFVGSRRVRARPGHLKVVGGVAKSRKRK